MINPEAIYVEMWRNVGYNVKSKEAECQVVLHYNYSHLKLPVLVDDNWAIRGKYTKSCIHIVGFWIVFISLFPNCL